MSRILSFLEQEGVRRMTRGLDQPGGFAGLLNDIGNAPATRGAARLGGRDEFEGRSADLPGGDRAAHLNGRARSPHPA